MGKRAITWEQLLALMPCKEGAKAALAAFPDWPIQPPTWEAVLAKEEDDGYRCWLISHALDKASAVEWARLCANSVAHLQSIAAAKAAYWAAGAANSAAYWAAYWVDRAVERAAEYKDEAHSIPSVYSLALTLLEAL